MVNHFLIHNPLERRHSNLFSLECRNIIPGFHLCLLALGCSVQVPFPSTINRTMLDTKTIFWEICKGTNPHGKDLLPADPKYSWESEVEQWKWLSGRQKSKMIARVLHEEGAKRIVTRFWSLMARTCRYAVSLGKHLLLQSGEPGDSGTLLYIRDPAGIFYPVSIFPASLCHRLLINDGARVALFRHSIIFKVI